MNQIRIAVLIPCYNEGLTLSRVISGFKQQIPHATIYVYDNGSTDDSVQIAKAADVIVKHVALRGKGQVVRRMFADVDADIYVMVDGDDTYDASCINAAIDKLTQQMLDMLVITRVPLHGKTFPLGHTAGNKWFTAMVNFLFGKQFHDIFSGYRVFSRRFVKSFPAVSHGFEIEAEMSIHALQLSIPCGEIAAPYQSRPPGSASKLKTLRDGMRILRTVLLLFLYIRPMVLFGILFFILSLSSFSLGLPIILTFIHTGFVPRFPTALLAASLGLIACLSLACGIVLDSVSRARLETKRCWYLLAAMAK